MSSRSSALPSLLATAANFAIFSTICAVAHQWHGWKQLQSALSTSSDKRDKGDKRKRLIVISGCDRGFGRLLAEKLNETTDYLVLALVLTDKGLEELNAVADTAANGEKRLFVLQCDVTSDENIENAKGRVSQILEEQDAILYSIVNNAGIADPGDFIFFSNLDIFKRVMDVNFFGQLRLTQALLPSMLRTSQTIADGARILNLSSVGGSSAAPSNTSYNASKFAVEGWSDSLRLELEAFNIKVVKIRPGQISTAIQTDYSSNLLKNYKAAPSQIRDLYGGDAYGDKVSKIFEGIAAGPQSKPSLVTDTLTEILEMRGSKLAPSYWVGNDAHTLWRAFHSLPATVGDSVKRLFVIAPIQIDVPQVDIISHVTITVKNIDKALTFYQKFGLEIVGEKKNGCQFLRSRPSKSGWPTHVLLKEDENMASRGNSSNIGMTRLCMYCPNAKAEAARLEKQCGLTPMAPPATSKLAAGAYIAAYQDPDGFVIYILQLPPVINIALRCSHWWNKVKTPNMFHWTVNVSDIKAGMAIFEKLGFVKVTDGPADKVVYDLLPAFGISQAVSVVEHYRLCKLPKDSFVATVFKWGTPKSEVGAAALLNTMTISVRDVPEALEKAKALGMVEIESPKYVDLPVFGKVHVGAAYVESGANRIEFCCFTNKLE
eukprot:CAMPEP_0119006496 /NCGR_PEP_ID=MMETSP1176-20130426/2323_1 /TAXON_ID=265551 /ORGANISM="Synedropsis recta cf, Strain CCMP1620" /LENGTH=658 /DNA_ID=CAMNT_0006958409 /DNA_START=69 /DNA_END=2045 /DNA_ORIENTATION=+